MYELADFSFHHAFEVGLRLRDEDFEECLANGFSNPVDAIIDSVVKSDVFETVFYEGQPAGVLGFIDDGEDGCQVWLVGTDELSEHPLALMRAFREARDVILSEYSIIYNKIYAGNSAHVRWLEALGAEIHKTDDPDFLFFEISK